MARRQIEIVKQRTTVKESVLVAPEEYEITDGVCSLRIGTVNGSTTVCVGCGTQSNWMEEMVPLSRLVKFLRGLEKKPKKR